MMGRRLYVWSGICGLLLLAAGGALGFVAAKWLADPGRSSASRNLFPDSSHYTLVQSQEIWEELELEEDQKQRIRDLIAEHYATARELRGRLEGLAAKTHAALVGVLDDRQRKGLAEIQTRYSETHIESEAIREIVQMRREIGLAWEQEPDVYQVIYDYLAAKHAYFRSLRERKKRPERSAVRAKLEELSERRFYRLGDFLDEEQLTLYRQIVEERRKWWEKRKKHHRRRGREEGGEGEEKARGSAGKAEAPAAAGPQPCE